MTEVSTKEKGIIKQKEEYLPTEKIEGDPAYIGLSAGATVNLHGFEIGKVNNAKINISITYPCERGQENKVFNIIKDWVDKRVGEEISELVSSASKPKDIEI